ncbi:carbohydrate esterase family 8 protein [Viridothelium virens]|uniref:pectinesterase n=1 Tax=Viridothelium virens TaxID=1048519 RepID=A0A6A6HBU5_VIRVR|nr:carbohydrate esterase family 8 protein [Viridothelium virens]
MYPGSTILGLLPFLALTSSLPTSELPSYGSTFNRTACQLPSTDPLAGCPENTVLVGPTSNAHFSTIQSAILSIPNNTTPYTILVLPGNYTEQLNITRPGPVYLLGQTPSPYSSNGSNNQAGDNPGTKNRVVVIWHQATGTATTGTLDNAFTSTLTIAPTLNSSLTGAGPDGNTVPAGTPFGNTDFRAYNIDFVNAYLPYSAGPSLALSISYANAGFYGVGFFSYQDTVYVGKLASVYMKGGTVAGQTDFFYGFGTLWAQGISVLLRGCGGGITAWKGTNTTFVNKYGVYLHDSVVRKANSSLSIAQQCALGRPWNAQMRSIFANCYLDDSIEPSGYIEWQSTDPRLNYNTSMAEYQDYGPGFNLTGRVQANITRLLTSQQYEPYSTPEKVFEYPFSGKFGNIGWIDPASYP